MFKIFRGKGFHMTFENGYTISVQWGAGNYCENENKDMTDYSNPRTYYGESDKDLGKSGCINAEIAILNKNRELIELPEEDDNVKGYCSADEVLKWMNYAASLPKEPKYD